MNSKKIMCLNCGKVLNTQYDDCNCAPTSENNGDRKVAIFELDETHSDSEEWVSEEILLKPKFEVTVRIKTHCTGCGLVFQIETIHEPTCFDLPELMVNQIKSATHSLLKANCPGCKKRMKQTSFYKETYTPR